MLAASIYNVKSAPRDGSVAVFNTLTQNLAVVDQDIFECLDELPLGRTQELVKLGFAVPPSLDERFRSRQLREQVRKETRADLVVTIVPSLTCDMSCGYCFNGIGHKDRYDPSTVETAIRYIAQKASSKRSIHVTWYGGEPLLRPNVIFAAMRRIEAIASEHGIPLTADLLSNGTRLTPNLARQLINHGVSMVQVSTDWPLDMSERRSGNRSAKETMAVVVENLLNCPKEMRIVLRINAMPGFLATLDELLSELSPMKERSFHVYTHRIFESNIAAMNGPETTHLRYEQSREFWEEYLLAKRKIRNAGFHQDYFPEARITAICTAEKEDDGFFVPGLQMRKCFQEVTGPGAIQEDGQVNEIGRAYLDSVPFNDPVCRECTYQPICFGGCVKERLENPDERERRCVPWKFTLEEELTLWLEEQLNGRR